jgi:hypothetical protein
MFLFDIISFPRKLGTIEKLLLLLIKKCLRK